MASKGGSTRYMKDCFFITSSDDVWIWIPLEIIKVSYQGIVVFPRREQHLQNLNKQNQKDNRFPDQVVRG